LTVEPDERRETVGPLKKVVFHLEAGRETDFMDFTPGPVPCAMIYGLGVSGLSPLESALSGKREGDVCILHLGRNDLSGFFQHIFIPPLGIPETVDSFTLKITVAGVSLPDQREVIRAMADMADCGSHCCGHHAST
jgi:hypothetical protein